MVQHRDRQQVGHRAGGQRHQAAGDIDALHLAAGAAQPRVDEGLVLGRWCVQAPRLRWRRQDSTSH